FYTGFLCNESGLAGSGMKSCLGSIAKVIEIGCLMVDHIGILNERNNLFAIFSVCAKRVLLWLGCLHGQPFILQHFTCCSYEVFTGFQSLIEMKRNIIFLHGLEYQPSWRFLFLHHETICLDSMICTEA